MFSTSLIENNKFVSKTYNFKIKNELKLCSDSRSFKSGMAFLGIKGEKFDGGKFLETILKEGCPYAIIDETTFLETEIIEFSKKYPDTIISTVKDTVAFVQELARARRDEWVSRGGKIIGVTGSNGKTTTKEMIFAFANVVYPEQVLKTKGNLNNHLGVPFTLLDLEDRHKVAIVEMGTNHPGEIEFLCQLAKPHSGIISSVGIAHIEFFGSVKNILEEKAALYRYIRDHSNKESIFLLNALDDNLKTLKTFPGVIRLGDEVKYEIKSDMSVEISWNESELTFKNKNIEEDYNIHNLIAAFLLVNSVLPGHTVQLVNVLNNFEMPKLNRSEWISDAHRKIFLDAYNANPTSMKAALKSFRNSIERNQIPLEKTLVVIGDMNELGDQAKEQHHDVANLLNTLGFKRAIFIGRFAHYYQEVFEGNFVKVYGATTELKKDWQEYYLNHEYFFLKASRSLQLESIIDIR